jgi:hypothetical protein
VSIDNADSDSHGDTERNSYGYANPHSNANSDTNAHGNTDRDSYSYAGAHTDTYTNCDSNSNSCGDTDTNANRNSIWEYMPAANDGESYSCSQHAVQFHGSGQRDRCDAEDSFKRRSRS